ncbi:hypothetical protein ABMA28_000786 [Loxostege sticticalis]|uniref:Reverse transcriptase domain-containing protein n=1 Tax=Loxostege sticticalis TaxID=481309 RepID=A0ABD0T3J2_LOXSC
MDLQTQSRNQSEFVINVIVESRQRNRSFDVACLCSPNELRKSPSPTARCSTRVLKDGSTSYFTTSSINNPSMQSIARSGKCHSVCVRVSLATPARQVIHFHCKITAITTAYDTVSDVRSSVQVQLRLYIYLTDCYGKVFNEILYTGRIPSQWAESHIILIHKKGPKDDIGNYRPISLISNVYKVFAKVILDRISLTLDENQPVEQAGFRKDFSTIDHIHTVKQLIQKYNEYNKTIYLAFIDYAKAFDSLKHESVWQSLREQGIQNSYVNIIKNIYSESKARIRLESIGETFPIEKGVRQGDPLSPKLFTAVLEQLFRKLDWGHLGLNINGTRLSHLRFADDLVILEEDPITLESMIQTLVDRSREVGLEMNTSKTKMMTNSIPIDITINGQKLEYVKEYVYLGQIISPKDQMSKEIDKRIASGWKTFWALKEIMKSKELGMKIKKKTFDTCILPCITYGCETWALTKHHRDKLVRCQRSMERSMLGLKLMDKIRSTDIRRKTKLTDILLRIDKLKWRWTGHMLRCKKEKDGTRKQGRKVRRWEDDLKLTLGPHWIRVAADRKQWKELEEAFAVRHTEIRDIL